MLRCWTVVAGCVLVASAGAVHAQVNGIMLPVPPLPSIGLPLPRIGLPPLDEPEPAPDEPEPSRRARRRSANPPVVVLAPVFVGPSLSTPATVPARSERTPGPPVTGTLELVPSSGAYLVFVDGYFAGTSDQIGPALALEAGPHTVELRAEGRPAQSARVRIVPGRVLRYEDAFTLAPEAVAPEQTPAAAAVPPPQTVYVIAGCYAGNVPPAQVALPRGCDAAKATTLGR